MTAAFLQLELSNLISDSKRKHSEIKTAAEKSLSELKSISVTSETQLAGDLIRKQHFIEPFVLACNTQNVKLASIGAACLQRLVASTAIPRSRLLDVLQALEGAVPLALEVQLKILQTLPSLLQLYAADLYGEALSRILAISADLSASKLPMVSSTAGATFQQLVNTVFARIPSSTKSTSQAQDDTSDAARDRDDALSIFVDLCALLTGEKACFVRLDNLPPSSVLETLESLLASHGSAILDDADALKACTQSLVPGLCNLVEESASYGVVVRAIRISFLLATQYLDHMVDHFSALLKVLLKAADRSTTIRWKRVVSLEFFRGLCSDFDSLRAVFAAFDLKDSNANIVSDLMALLVRTASEDPSIIGLSRQSTIPTSTATESGADTTASVDVPTAGSAQSRGHLTGISVEWSTIATPCLDTADRTKPIDIPETYIYALVIGSITAFSDGLSKFVMPLSVPNRKPSRIEEVEADAIDDSQPTRRPSLKSAATAQKYQQLVNPLMRKDFNRRNLVENCARMIESCWPAILAACSTFLNAALDSYFYHMLIRTVQKLTQVSGVLELDTPRDALLTTLAKVAVPASVSSLMSLHFGAKPARADAAEGRPDMEDQSIKSPVASTPRQSLDMTLQSLNVRNLLCLRALLNLGIALGPTLSQNAWMIVMQSLEQVEALMSVGPTAKIVKNSLDGTETSQGASQNTLATEVNAVDTARRRMLEASASYSGSAFETLCRALWQMIEDVIPPQESVTTETSNSNGSLWPKASTHKPARSVSGNWAKTATLEVEVQFVLKTVGRLASENLHRFRNVSSSTSSWSLIVARLLSLHSNRDLVPSLRLQAARIIDAIVVEACLSTPSDEDSIETSEMSTIVVQYGIPALSKQLDNVIKSDAHAEEVPEITTNSTHAMLESLSNIVGSCGNTLNEGWSKVFRILNTAVSSPSRKRAENGDARVYSSAFRIVLLVVSDFLPLLEAASLAALVSLFSHFATQTSDLNMSLTTIGLYLNVVNVVVERAKHLDVVFHKAYSLDNVRTIADVWQPMVLGLANVCKDDQADIRNAALRMLFTIIESSIPCMSAVTLHSYLTEILVPLLEFYSKSHEASEAAWRDSALKTFDDMCVVFQSHNVLLMSSSTSFQQSWGELVRSASILVDNGELQVTTVVLNSLASTVASLRQSDRTSNHGNIRKCAEQALHLWTDHHPAEIETTAPNAEALASHAQLLLELLAWDVASVVGLEDAQAILFRAASKSILEARHDQYTVDVRKMSPEQEQILKLFKTIRSIFPQETRSHLQQILVTISKLVDRTVARSNESRAVTSTSRQPTGMAFCTSLLEELRVTLDKLSSTKDFWRRVPVKDIIEASAKLTSTKYGPLPSSDQDPLWQKAGLLGTQCMTIIEQKENLNDSGIDADSIASPINALMEAVLTASNLDMLPTDSQPSAEQIRSDEDFDVHQLKSLHTAAFKLHASSHTGIGSQRDYVLLLFKQSLVAKPWYNDLTRSLKNNPLDNLPTIRRGSIRAPALPIRREIYIQALACLFDLATIEPPASQPPPTITTLAASYILLRTAHTLKTFIADQPLRYLQHPDRSLQHELNIVLTSFVNLRVNDDAFVESAKELGCDVSSVIRGDGKSHLRILIGLMGRFESVWYQMPRLEIGAWQGYPDGHAVEQALKMWRKAVSEGWAPEF